MFYDQDKKDGYNQYRNFNYSNYSINLVGLVNHC